MIVDKDGEIQEVMGEETDKKKLSTIAVGATNADHYATTRSGCDDFSNDIVKCGYVIGIGVWNYLGAETNETLALAGAARIHDYLESVAIVEAAQATADKAINAVADSRIPNAFDEIGKVHKAGDTTACIITKTATIKTESDRVANADGNGCKYKADDVKDDYAGATDAEKAAKAKVMTSAYSMAGDEYFTSKIGTKVADTIIARTTGEIVGYDNAIGNHTILANQPALLKKIVLNYEADVVQQNGEWVNSPSFDTPEKQAFAMEYNLLAKNLCGSQSGKESDFSGVQEVGKCITAYYAYVGAVTTACTTQAEEISPDCAAGFAGKLIAAYGGQFDNEGIPHLNAADEAQGNAHYEL